MSDYSFMKKILLILYCNILVILVLYNIWNSWSDGGGKIMKLMDEAERLGSQAVVNAHQ